VRSRLKRSIAAVAATLLVLTRLTAPAWAQEATATAVPMTLPKIPSIQLQTVPAYGPAPLTVGYFVSSIDPETVLQSFAWNLGDGQVSMLPPTALFHTYTNPGSYVVTVTATTSDGHSATSFAAVIVTQPPQ
jgi:PKD repeat protein